MQKSRVSSARPQIPHTSSHLPVVPHIWGREAERSRLWASQNGLSEQVSRAVDSLFVEIEDYLTSRKNFPSITPEKIKEQRRFVAEDKARLLNLLSGHPHVTKEASIFLVEVSKENIPAPIKELMVSSLTNVINDLDANERELPRIVSILNKNYIPAVRKIAKLGLELGPFIYAVDTILPKNKMVQLSEATFETFQVFFDENSGLGLQFAEKTAKKMKEN